jgi:hypothetical protein
MRIGVGLALLVGVLVTAFAWPAAESQPRDLPIAVAGPPDAVAQIEQRLEAAAPGAFEIEAAPEADRARQLIEEREVYAAILLDPAGPPQVLIASAASPTVAQLITALAAQMDQSQDTASPAVSEC